uniref:Abhydrolase_3 domain-containing protein n=1 Tax=Rodentolepis nana TaxID=102285 RepID=A0A0R3T3C8_RODNA
MTTTKEEKSHNCRTNGTEVDEVPLLVIAPCSLDSPFPIPLSLLCGREGRSDPFVRGLEAKGVHFIDTWASNTGVHNQFVSLSWL